MQIGRTENANAKNAKKKREKEKQLNKGKKGSETKKRPFKNGSKLSTSAQVEVFLFNA